jgi:hypothetical protein
MIRASEPPMKERRSLRDSVHNCDFMPSSRIENGVFSTTLFDVLKRR